MKQIGLSHRIHLLGTRQDVPNLLSGCDLFALPTQQEASGTVFVEAAACGLPVVATDVGGVSEMMRAGQTGFLVPAKDADALRQTLARLIDDPELRVKMGRAGYDMVWKEEVFTTHTLARETESVYRSWLTTQLKQQDPTDPVDNKEMIAQMAQFSSLSGIEQINSTLKDITARLDRIIPAGAAKE